MSQMNSIMEGTSSSGGSAPKLLSGANYAAWRPNMEVYMQRHGANGIYKKPLEKDEWLQDEKDVEAWEQHELGQARAAARGEKIEADSELLQKGRKAVMANVDRSRKAYGVIFFALPLELQQQVQHLPSGWAYGLWMWLEQKFQSTEADHVSELLEKWLALRMEVNESYDSFYARASQVVTLLTYADQKPTPEVYCLIMLDRLQPGYDDAVLALKVSGKLQDKKSIDWDEVKKIINNHERNKKLVVGGSAAAGAAADGTAMAARTWSNIGHGAPASDARGSNHRGHNDSGRDRNAGHAAGSGGRTISCFACGQKGHIARMCPGNKASGKAETHPKQGNNRAMSVDQANNQGDRSVKESVAAVTVARPPAGGDDDEFSWTTVTRKDRRGYKIQANNNGKEASAQVTPVKGAGAWRQGATPSVTPVREKDDGINERALSGRAQVAPLKTDQSSAAVPHPYHYYISTPAVSSASQVAALSAVGGDSQVSFSPTKNVRDFHPEQRVAQQSRGGKSDAGGVPAKSILKQGVPKFHGGIAMAAAAVPAGQAVRELGVDSMASVNVSGSKALFTRGLRSCKPFSVRMADDGELEVTQVGSIDLHINVTSGQTVTFVIEDVYYHPKFGANLLSLHWLTEHGWKFNSSKAETYLLTPNDNLKVHLNKEKRVSVLRCGNYTAGSKDSKGTGNRVFAIGELDISWDSATDLVRLHERLGHIGFDHMIRILKSQKTTGLGKLNMGSSVLRDARKRVLECRACTRGKGTRTAFGHRGLDRGSSPGEVLHMDTFYVKYKNALGTQCKEYGLVISCPYSTFRWVAPAQTKDRVAELVVNIVKEAQTQFNCKVKRLHTDGGTEFINQTVRRYCTDQGITLHYGPAKTPQMNSIAERQVRSGKDAARTLLMHAGLPARFWWDAMRHATIVWNRTNVASTTGVTPHEAMRKCKPNVQHLGVFGCDAYYHIPKDSRDTFEAKMAPGIYLGHDLEQGCPIIYDMQTGKHISSRDVQFRDRRFTHAAALHAGGPALMNVLSGSAYTLDNIPVAGTDPAPNAEFEDDPNAAGEVHEVERIIGKRVRNGVTEYRVKWAGYSEDSATWEPVDHVDLGARDALEEFEAQLDYESDSDSSSHSDEEAASDHEEDEPDESKYDEPEESKHDEPVVSSSAAPAAVPAAVQPAASAPAAASTSAPAYSTRWRSPRVHASSASLDSAGQQNVQMAMSVIRSVLPGGDSGLSESDGEMVAAVATGLAQLEANTPKNWKEAMASPDAAKWKAAAEKEIQGCEQMNVWDLVPRSSVPKHQIISSKWVFKVKTDSNGKIEKYKARLTPRGFEQIEGINFSETFAATGMYKTMRVGLALTAACDNELDQMDVIQAFLNADVDEDEPVYVEVPEGPYRKGKEHLVMKLKKSLYGLKQAPRNWYLLCKKFVYEQLGFKPTVSDPCLFFKRSRTGRLMFMFLFVDDFQISYHITDKAEWNELKAKFMKRFESKDLGPSTWILGMRIKRDRKARTITLDQELYVTKALERFGMDQCKVAPTPGVVGGSTAEGRGTDSDPDHAGSGKVDRQLYQEMVGTLMYSAISCRPDIAHSVQLLARAMQAPTWEDMRAAKRVFRYLAGTKDIGLMFGSHQGGEIADTRGRSSNRFCVEVCSFADADWANDKTDRKSITGWVAKVNGDPISWASKKQRTVAQSTCEAELYAEAAAIQEVLWLRGMLQELGLYVKTGSVVHGDNQSTIAVSKNGIKASRTKHVDVKYHFITETVEAGTVQLKWVPTTEQQADIFTKALHAPAFEHFRQMIMTR